MDKAIHSSLVSEIYTSLSDIKTELARRRNDPHLKKKVEDFLGSYLLPELTLEPKAVLSRTVINPNAEFRYFLELAHTMGLAPLGLEYHDKFVARNPDKYHLARLYFAHKRKDGTQYLSSIKLVDFNKYEGENFRKIKTIHGQSLVDFHHNLLITAYPEMKDNVRDISLWFQITRHLSSFYYLYFLALFIYHGVLFDNFLLDEKGEADFFLEKIYPSFQELQKIFGVKPLIYPLLPVENAKGRQWMSYEEKIKKWVEDSLNSGIIGQ